MPALLPPHEPTDDTRTRVREVLAGGGTRQDAAAAIGVSYDTLRRHYADVLAECPPPRPQPPEGARFRPGESGNPAGVSKSRAEFQEMCRLAAPELLAEALRRLATLSDASLINGLVVARDTGYGKPKDTVEHSGQIVLQISQDDADL